MSCVEKVVMVSFPLVLFFPTIPIFSHHSFVSWIVIQSAAPAALPLSFKGTMAPHHRPHLLVAWIRRWW
jgi:hypothetical protein